MGPYLFSEHTRDREWNRMRMIEMACDPATVALLEHTGIGAGWACVELGAGAGSMVEWMGTRVGSNGSVMAIDASTVHLHRFMSAPYRVIEEDFLNVPLECHADLLHARYVLIHNQQSEAILKKIRASMKPGGYVVLEEPDFTSATLPNASMEPALQRVNQAICRMFLEAGLDPGYGIGLPRRMAREGFDIVRVSSTMHLCPGLGPVANLMAASAAALREKYIGTGITTDQDIDRYVTCAQDSGYWALYYSTVSVIATVQ